MANLSFSVRRNDHLPVLDATLTDRAGTAVDLSSAETVAFHMATAAGATPKIEAAAAVTSASAGEVRYSWVEGDTDTAGTYIAEFQVTWGDGRRETFPNTGFIEVVVTEDIA